MKALKEVTCSTMSEISDVMVKARVRWLLLQVLMNLYSAHMDPDDWQQPHQFRPERFLDQSGNVVGRDRVIPFGLGTSAVML